jgi:hypothetical protein
MYSEFLLKAKVSDQTKPNLQDIDELIPYEFIDFITFRHSVRSRKEELTACTMQRYVLQLLPKYETNF